MMRDALCDRPKHGVVVGPDTIAAFPTRAPLAELRRRCMAGDTILHDAVGWQAVAWVFPFDGARVVAVQSKHGFGESLRENEPADLWTVEGDSVRLADGELLPRTLGALRERYGQTIVDANVAADDVDGPHARSCRWPYVLFALAVKDTARLVPDSARITGVQVSVPVDTTIVRVCAAPATDSAPPRPSSPPTI
jgi:hypothetical protein